MGIVEISQSQMHGLGTPEDVVNHLRLSQDIRADSPPLRAVIQGPITSIGRTFGTTQKHALGQFKTESELIVEFDAAPTILANIEALLKRNVKVVYSGWSDNCNTDLCEKIEKLGAKVVLSNPNDAPALVREGKMTGVLSKNNKAKQYYSLLRGLQAVEDELSRAIVIKLRSDISLDFDKLFTDIAFHKEKLRSGSLLVQYFRHFHRSPFPALWLSDFWFAGRGDVLYSLSEDLYTRALHERSYSESPHRDLAVAAVRYYFPYLPPIRVGQKSWKVLLQDLFFKLQIFYILSLSKAMVNRFCAALLEREMRRVEKKRFLIPASKHIEHSIIWRGDSYANALESDFYQAIERSFKFGDT